MGEKGKYIVLEATISDAHEMMDEAKRPYTAYEIRVARGKFQWTVFHRFSEFDEIRKNLAKTYPNVMSWPNFPGKKLINKTSAKVVEERKTQLNKWIQEILKRSPINKDQALCVFLQADPDAIHPYVSMLKTGDSKEKRDGVDALETLRDEMVKQGCFKLLLNYASKEDLPVQRVSLRIAVPPSEVEPHPIVSSGGMKVLVQFTKIKDPELSHLALTIISHAVRLNGDFQTRVIKELTFAPYMELVKQAVASSSNTKTIQSLQALCYLSEQSDANRVILARPETFKILIDEVAVDVLCEIVKVMGVLAMDGDGKREIVECGGLIVLRKLATKLAADLQTTIAHTMGNFCANIDKSLVHDVVEIVLDTILPLLGARTVEAFRHTVRALACFSEHAKKMMDALYAGHAKYNGDEDCDRFTARIIANVCFLAAARADGVGANGIIHLKQLYAAPYPDSKAYTLKAIVYLLSTPGDEAKQLWSDDIWVKSRFATIEPSLREDIKLFASYAMWALKEIDKVQVGAVWEAALNRLGRLSMSTELADHREAIRIIQTIIDLSESFSPSDNIPAQGSYAPMDQAHISSTGTGPMCVMVRQGGSTVQCLVALTQSTDGGVVRAACKLLLRIGTQHPNAKVIMDSQGLVRICVQGIKNTSSVRTQVAFLSLLSIMTEEERIKSSFLEEGHVMLKKVGEKLKISEPGSLAALLDLLDGSSGDCRRLVKVILNNFGIDSENPTSSDQLYRQKYRLGAVQRRLLTSVIRQAQDTQRNEKVSMKFIVDEDVYNAELKLLSELGADYVAGMIEKFDPEEVDDDDDDFGLASATATQLTRYGCIVTEAYDMTLSQFVRKVNMSVSGRMQCVKRLCECIAHLHHNKIVHGFITPNTICHFGDTWKITGLDNARRVGETSSLKFSMRYCSPELAVAVRNSEAPTADPAMDMYALGCIIFELYHGDSLFEDHSDVLKLLVSPSPLDVPLESIMDRQIQKLLTKLLVKDPKARPTIDEVIAMLEVTPAADKAASRVSALSPKAIAAKKSLLGDDDTVAENDHQSPSPAKQQTAEDEEEEDEEEEEDDDDDDDDEPKTLPKKDKLAPQVKDDDDLLGDDDDDL